MDEETKNEFKEVYKRILSLEERQERILNLLNKTIEKQRRTTK